MSHSLETIIRKAYAAYGRGDIDGYLHSCTEDFNFNVPGSSALAGSFRGREGLYELTRRAIEISGGTFSEEVEDVLVNDRHAVLLNRHRFIRDGKPKDYRTAHIYEIRNGKLAACWEHPRDQAELDDAWGPAR